MFVSSIYLHNEYTIILNVLSASNALVLFWLYLYLCV